MQQIMGIIVCLFIIYGTGGIHCYSEILKILIRPYLKVWKLATELKVFR